MKHSGHILRTFFVKYQSRRAMMSNSSSKQTNMFEGEVLLSCGCTRKESEESNGSFRWAAGQIDLKNTQSRVSCQTTRKEGQSHLQHGRKTGSHQKPSSTLPLQYMGGDPMSSESKPICRSKTSIQKIKMACQRWFGNVWLNPPYHTRRWSRYQRRLSSLYRQVWIVSCFCRITPRGSKWGQDILINAKCYLFPQVSYPIHWRFNRKETKSPLQGQNDHVVSRKNVDHAEEVSRFMAVFSKIGVVIPWDTKIFSILSILFVKCCTAVGFKRTATWIYMLTLPKEYRDGTIWNYSMPSIGAK